MSTTEDTTRPAPGDQVVGIGINSKKPQTGVLLYVREWPPNEAVIKEPECGFGITVRADSLRRVEPAKVGDQRG